jgi:protein subunit release factor A
MKSKDLKITSEKSRGKGTQLIASEAESACRVAFNE